MKIFFMGKKMGLGASNEITVHGTGEGGDGMHHGMTEVGCFLTTLQGQGLARRLKGAWLIVFVRAYYCLQFNASIYCTLLKFYYSSFVKRIILLIPIW